MCGRYYIASEDSHEELARLIDELNRRETAQKADFKIGEVFPGDNALVVSNSRKLVSRPFVMKWGFHQKDGRLLINARSETAPEKPMFSELIGCRRALIPASGYFEWAKNGKTKTKYALSTEENMLFLAGLYRPKANSKNHEFVILTADAAPEIQFIHSRMPVAFSVKQAEAWLNPENSFDRLIRDSIRTFDYKKAEGI